MKYCLLWMHTLTHEIKPISTRLNNPKFIENALKKRVKDADDQNLKLSMVNNVNGYKLAVNVVPVEGGEFDKPPSKIDSTKLINAILNLLNAHDEPDFGLERVAKSNPATPPPQAAGQSSQTTELATVDDAEIIEVLEGDMEIITRDLVLDPRLKAVLSHQIRGIVPDADKMSENDITTIANNMVYTRCPIIGQDGFYYYPDKGRVVIIWGYGLLLKIARYMDKIKGGNGLVEFRDEPLTDEEIAMLKVNEGDTVVKLRMISSSSRKEHHQAMKEFNETAKDFVTMGASFKEALEEAKKFYPHINNQVGIVGYGVFRKGAYSHKSWTTYDMAKKYALKNLIKTNFNMPTKQDWAAIAEGTISQMDDSEFAKFLAKRGEFLKAKNVGVRELNILAADDKNWEKTIKESEQMTTEERAEKFEKTVNLLRGEEENGID